MNNAEIAVTAENAANGLPMVGLRVEVRPDMRNL